MKEVDVGGVGQALLVRDGSSFYAVGPKCSHYGALLEKGKWETSLRLFFLSCSTQLSMKFNCSLKLKC